MNFNFLMFAALFSVLSRKEFTKKKHTSTAGCWTRLAASRMGRESWRMLKWTLIQRVIGRLILFLCHFQSSLSGFWRQQKKYVEIVIFQAFFEFTRRERNILKCTTTYGIITINGTVLVYVVRITIQFSHPHSLCPVRKPDAICFGKNQYTHREERFTDCFSGKKSSSRRKRRDLAAIVSLALTERREKNRFQIVRAFHFRLEQMCCVFSLFRSVCFFFVETLLNCTQFAFQTSSGGKC